MSSQKKYLIYFLPKTGGVPQFERVPQLNTVFVPKKSPISNIVKL